MESKYNHSTLDLSSTEDISFYSKAARYLNRSCSVGIGINNKVKNYKNTAFFFLANVDSSVSPPKFFAPHDFFATFFTNNNNKTKKNSLCSNNSTCKTTTAEEATTCTNHIT